MTDTRATTAGIDRRRAAHLLGLVVLGVVVFLFVAGAVPQVVGADHSYVVLSDSMSPTIDAGAVVFVSEVPADDIGVGAVITYEQSVYRADTRRVTHRVVVVVERSGERRFQTKGDANDDPDPTLVAPSQVVGVVQFHVPYVGYVTSFAQTSAGILALVVVPAVLLAISEMWDLATAESGKRDDPETDAGGADDP